MQFDSLERATGARLIPGSNWLNLLNEASYLPLSKLWIKVPQKGSLTKCVDGN